MPTPPPAKRQRTTTEKARPIVQIQLPSTRKTTPPKTPRHKQQLKQLIITSTATDGHENGDEDEDDASKLNHIDTRADLDLEEEKENLEPSDSVKLELMDDDMHQLPTPKPTPSKSSRRPTSAPSSPSTPTKPSRGITNIFTHAHYLLSTSYSPSSHSNQFLGREKEQKEITEFLANRFPQVYDSEGQGEEYPSMYISGPPGIGKTALLSNVLREFEQLVKKKGRGDVKVHMENCASVGSAGAVEREFWDRLIKGLGMGSSEISSRSKGKGKNKTTGREAFEEGLKEDGQFLIVLDEIDHLLSSSSSSTKRTLLNALFHLSHLPNSPLTLIGIANSLTLTHTNLDSDELISSILLSSPAPSPPSTPSSSTSTKNGQARGQPKLVHFRPYDDAALEVIVRQRLQLLHGVQYPLSSPLDIHLPNGNDDDDEPSADTLPLPLVHPNALKYCAKKISSVTGDVRLILEVVRKSIEIVEWEERQKAPPTSSSPSTSFSNTMDECEATRTRKVTMPEMALALRQCGLVPPSPLSSRIAELPFGARNVLVAVVVGLKRLSDEVITSSLDKEKNKVFTTPTKKLKTSSPTSSSSSSSSSTNVLPVLPLHRLYLDLFLAEGTLPSSILLSKTEFISTLEMLESSAFLRCLPLSNVSSPSSGKGKGKGKGKGSSGGGGGVADLGIVLSSGTQEVWEALEVTPATSGSGEEGGMGKEKGKMGKGALEESLRISRAILREEDRRRRRRGDGERRKREEREVAGEAPREGWKGSGLEGAGPVGGRSGKAGKGKGKGNDAGSWIGEKRKREGAEGEGEGEEEEEEEGDA